MIIEQKVSIRKAAEESKMPESTARNWVHKINEEELNNDKAGAKKSTEIIHENHPEQQKSKQVQTLNDKPHPISSPVKEKRTYRKYAPEERKKLLSLVFKENMTVAQAARELQMPDSTARYWVAKYKDSIFENEAK